MFAFLKAKDKHAHDDCKAYASGLMLACDSLRAERDEARQKLISERFHSASLQAMIDALKGKHL